MANRGDPKTKSLRLFLSAVRRRTIKNSPDIAPVRRPTSDLGPKQWGQSYTMFHFRENLQTCPNIILLRGPSGGGGRTMKDGGRMAEGEQTEVFTSF